MIVLPNVHLFNRPNALIINANIVDQHVYFTTHCKLDTQYLNCRIFHITNIQILHKLNIWNGCVLLTTSVNSVHCMSTLIRRNTLGNVPVRFLLDQNLRSQAHGSIFENSSWPVLHSQHQRSELVSFWFGCRNDWWIWGYFKGVKSKSAILVIS